jgi:dihydrofolate reductase
MKISMIAAHDLNMGIGYKNNLPWHLPADFAFFKTNTLGKTILMGRKTFESIGKPLPGRRNIVLSRQQLDIDGVETIQHVDAIKQLDLDELMIIGGSSLYELFLPTANQILLTEVQASFCVDTYFPSFEQSLFAKTILATHPADDKNPYAMVFKQYSRR